MYLNEIMLHGKEFGCQYEILTLTKVKCSKKQFL
jgi:hypothetical protein